MLKQVKIKQHHPAIAGNCWKFIFTVKVYHHLIKGMFVSDQPTQPNMIGYLCRNRNNRIHFG